jgi:hypothetical protein
LFGRVFERRQLSYRTRHALEQSRARSGIRLLQLDRVKVRPELTGLWNAAGDTQSIGQERICSSNRAEGDCPDLGFAGVFHEEGAEFEDVLHLFGGAWV